MRFKLSRLLAIVCAFVMVFSTVAYAETVGYVMQEEDGTYTQYDLTLLADSYEAYQSNPNSAAADMYKRYAAAYIAAYVDDPSGYIEINGLADEYERITSDPSLTPAEIDAQLAAYQASPDAAKLANQQVTVVDKDGNLTSEVIIIDDNGFPAVNPPVSGDVIISKVTVESKTAVRIVCAEIPVEYYTAADADKFAVQVNGEAVAAPTDVKRVISDASGKTYDLTIATLDGKQGSLSVNGTAATVLDGKEYAFDNLAPKIEDVQALAKNQIMLTFSEKISTEVTIGKISIVPSAGGATPEVDKAIVQSNATKVLLTLKNGTDLKNGRNNYTMDLETGAVKDLAGNVNVDYQMPFNGVSTDDTLTPSLLTARYDKADGEITLTFNKNVSDSDFDITKISVGSVSFTDADSAAIIEEDTTQYTIKLSPATKTALDALSGSLTLTITAGAVEDANTAGLKNGDTSAALTVVATPELVAGSSNYDEATGTLTLGFSVAVKVTDVSKITLGSTPLEDTNVTDLSPSGNGAATTITMILDQDTRDKVQTTAIRTAGKIKVEIEANAVKAGDLFNKKVSGTDITFRKDDVKPELLSATFKNVDNSLELTFSKPVREEVAIPNGKATIYVGTAASFKDSNADWAFKSAVGNTAVYTVADASDTPAALDAIETAIASGKSGDIKLALKADAVKDCAGDKAVNANGNAAMTFANAIQLTVEDTTIPKLVTKDDGVVELISKTQMEITFTAAMDKATVENTANWTIKGAAENETISIKSVTLSTADPKVAYIVTNNDMNKATATEGSYYYTVTATGLKSKAGMLLNSPTNSAKFNGISAAADTKAPSVASVTFANQGENIPPHTITIVFNDANKLDKDSAVNLANYKLEEMDETTTKIIPLGTSTVSFGEAEENEDIGGFDTTVTITLKDIYLNSNKDYILTVSNVKDVLGNAIAGSIVKSTADNEDESVSFEPDGSDVTVEGSNAVISSGVVTIRLTFSVPMDKTSAEKIAGYEVGLNGKNVFTTTNNAKAILDNTGRIVTLTFNKPSNTNDWTEEAKTAITVKKTVSSLTGMTVSQEDNANKVTDVAIIDTTPPSLVMNSDANDAVIATDGETLTYSITLDYGVVLANVQDRITGTVKIGSATAQQLTADNVVKEYTVNAEDSSKLTIEFGTPIKFYAGDSVTVSIKNVQSDQGVLSASEVITLTAVSDKDAEDKEIQNATYTVNDAYATIALQFSDKLRGDVTDLDDAFAVSIKDGSALQITKVTIGGAEGKTVTIEIAGARSIAAGATLLVKKGTKYDAKIMDQYGNKLPNAIPSGGAEAKVAQAAGSSLRTGFLPAQQTADPAPADEATLTDVVDEDTDAIEQEAPVISEEGTIVDDVIIVDDVVIEDEAVIE